MTDLAWRAAFAWYSNIQITKGRVTRLTSHKFFNHINVGFFHPKWIIYYQTLSSRIRKCYKKLEPTAEKLTIRQLEKLFCSFGNISADI